jgi:hypothetical protein
VFTLLRFMTLRRHPRCDGSRAGRARCDGFVTNATDWYTCARWRSSWR